MPRRRRHSTVSFAAPRANGLFGRNSIRIKFKRKGSLLGGINLAEAQMRGIRLSNSESYYLSDMHPNRYDNVYLKVRWPGHQECTYQLPLDSYDNGRLDLETLARRVARSCVHYFQNNRIPVSWDRMELKCLDELEFGVWEPQLTVNHIL
ncbi:hypothetical protein BDZ89DRAFT_963458 [Hymenopellis radicata]|nr:hypothetical protein BDZ89DRAFT_963458 [Hymenopellis radicata]